MHFSLIVTLKSLNGNHEIPYNLIIINNNNNNNDKTKQTMFSCIHPGCD